MNYQEWLIERQQLTERIKELEAENAELRKRLGEDVVPVHRKPTAMRRLSLQEKIVLFRSLFRGREDVFARRWYSKVSGKGGYQPVCQNEWNHQLCDKRKFKCAECPNRQFSPLTDNDVYRHLEGKDADGRDVIGLYVLHEDNTCNLLCTDFDDKNCEHGYQEDVVAFVDVCKSWGECGPIRYNADAKGQMESQTFQRLLVPRFTPFRPVNGEDLSFTKVAQQLAEDEYRNLFIVKDVIEALKDGRSPIILTSRTAHVEILADLLKPHCPNVITLVGSESAKEKRQKMECLQSIPSTEPLVIVATGKYVGEGFDYARLDTLFLVSPVAWKGIVAQYAGRLHREFEGKQDVQIYDYIDIRVPVCESMYRKRLKGYAAIGYKIQNDEKFDCLFPTTDLIYNGQNFASPFVSDLSQCKHSVVISCPKVRIGRQTQIAERLIDLAANGALVTLYTREENEDTLRMQHQGISVIVKSNLSICTAIIDKRAIWYGSVKILGFHSAEDNLIRFKNPEIATNLLEAIQTRIKI